MSKMKDELIRLANCMVEAGQSDRAESLLMGNAYHADTLEALRKEFPPAPKIECYFCQKELVVGSRLVNLNDEKVFICPACDDEMLNEREE